MKPTKPLPRLIVWLIKAYFFLKRTETIDWDLTIERPSRILREQSQRSGYVTRELTGAWAVVLTSKGFYEDYTQVAEDEAWALTAKPYVANASPCLPS